ncbi:hypothetical protein D9M71_328500 [compost metagenome]
MIMGEVTNGGAWKKTDTGVPGRFGRQLQRTAEIIDQRRDIQLPVLLSQQRGRLVQGIGADVDGHVQRNLWRGVEQQAGFHAGATAELHQRRARWNLRSNLSRNLGQQRGFGARRVVLGRLADGLEQLGTHGVVEVFGWQAFLRGRQAADDIPAKLTVVVAHRPRLARIPGQP